MRVEVVERESTLEVGQVHLGESLVRFRVYVLFALGIGGFTGCVFSATARVREAAIGTVGGAFVHTRSGRSGDRRLGILVGPKSLRFDALRWLDPDLHAVRLGAPLSLLSCFLQAQKLLNIRKEKATQLLHVLCINLLYEELRV